MNVLDLFSGIGGMSVGLEKAGFKTVAFCDNDKRCHSILKKNWPEVPIFNEVSTLANKVLYESGIKSIDVICGGFPCQDISAARNGPGLTGKRSGLWGEYARIIGEIKPKYVIIENVANLRKRGLGTVLQDLACMGYDADWSIISAASVGAPHQRDSLWIVAKRAWEPVVISAECIDTDKGTESFCGHCRGDYEECSCFRSSSTIHEGWECVQEAWGLVAYPNSAGWREQCWPITILPEHIPVECYRWYQHEPAVGRVVNGILDRSYRIRKLGNAVVPFIPWMIGLAIKQEVEMMNAKIKKATE